jgi:hypothetical protein
MVLTKILRSRIAAGVVAATLALTGVFVWPAVCDAASRNGPGKSQSMRPSTSKLPLVRKPVTNVKPGLPGGGRSAAERRRGDGPKTQECLKGCDRVNATCTKNLSGGSLIENSTCWNYITRCIGDCRRRGG